MCASIAETWRPTSGANRSFSCLIVFFVRSPKGNNKVNNHVVLELLSLRVSPQTGGYPPNVGYKAVSVTTGDMECIRVPSFIVLKIAAPHCPRGYACYCFTQFISLVILLWAIRLLTDIVDVVSDLGLDHSEFCVSSVANIEYSVFRRSFSVHDRIYHLWNMVQR